MATNHSKNRRHRRSFGAIRQLPSGKFQASFQELSGEISRAPQTFATREAADQFLALEQARQIKTREAEKLGIRILDPNRGAELLGNFLTNYLASNEDWAEGTRQLNTGLARKWILQPLEGHYLADKRLDSISPFMVSQWLAALQRATHESAVKHRTPQPLNDSAAAKRWARKQGIEFKELGRASDELLNKWREAGEPQVRRREVNTQVSPAGRTVAAQTYRLLKTMFNVAIKNEMLDRNPCKDNPSKNLRERPRITATHEQVSLLAEAVPERYRVAVLVAAYSGAREGELFGLARRHFDPIRKVIKVERSVKNPQKKPAYLGTTKTKSSVREIALPASICAEIEKHMSEFTGESPDSIIFTTRAGSLVTSSEVSRWFKPALERAGLPVEMTWHELRHTGASFAASTGASLPAIMQRLGHSSAKAAMRYQQDSLRDREQIAERMEAQFQEATIYRLDEHRKATA